MLEALGGYFAEDFGGRVLPFDEAAAGEYAIVMAQRRRQGRPMAQMDAQIAAIARLHGATLATRNTKDFTDCGIDQIGRASGRERGCQLVKVTGGDVTLKK